MAVLHAAFWLVRDLVKSHRSLLKHVHASHRNQGRLTVVGSGRHHGAMQTPAVHGWLEKVGVLQVVS